MDEENEPSMCSHFTRMKRLTLDMTQNWGIVGAYHKVKKYKIMDFTHGRDGVLLLYF